LYVGLTWLTSDDVIQIRCVEEEEMEMEMEVWS